MIDGLYGVSFKTPGDSGGGTLIVTNGSINGGDRSHTYQGKLEALDNGVKATLYIHHFNKSFKSQFGTVGDFELEVSGSATDKSFDLSGHAKGQPSHTIHIIGRYLRPLV